jgi:branched-chain amino acid transport system substrate-binding protein
MFKRGEGMRYRNILRIIFISLMILLVLIGCGSKSETKQVKEIKDESIESSSKEVTDNDENKLEKKDENLEADSLKLYISADRTGTKESGIAIEQGIRTALSEVDYTVNGKKIEILILDHRGSTPRANTHLEKYLEDDKALVVFSGLHSPPLLASRDFINENEILVLDPWAAAAPITRYPSEENWVFRLSIDDSKAGYVISEYAVKKEDFKRPFLLLEETGWGESNERTMTSALNDFSVDIAGTAWFNWNLGINEAKMLLRQAKESDADVIFFVGNAPEGKKFAKAMSELEEEERLPIRSHWGITGGDFPEVVSNDIRAKIDLKFIQTSFSFIGMGDSKIGNKVFDIAKNLYPDSIKKVEDIKAPTGFIHSYDLTKILIRALEQSDLDSDINTIRLELRNNLENINGKVEGLIKTYDKPFTVFTEENPDAHEALNIMDFVMAKYGENNEIIILP